MQLPGLATGIDTGAMVQQLMAASQQRLYTYKVQKANYEEKNTTFDELRSKLLSFNSAMTSLSDVDDLIVFKATSNDTDILSASAASTGVYEGNHEVEINQLANAEKWVHSGFLFKESLVGSGNFIYSYNHEEITINTDTATTLDDLVGLINNDNNNPGVTASILEYDDGNEGVFHLVLSGNDAGSDYQISVNSSTTQILSSNITLDENAEEATLSTKITELDQFAGTLIGTEKIEITGTDRSGAAITQKDLNITDDITVGHLIDRINDAFEGVAKAVFEDGKITLTDDVSGVSLTSLTLTFSGAGGGDPASLTLPTFSDAAGDGGTEGGLLSNILSGGDFIRTQAAQDSQVKIDGYPPSISELQTLSQTGVATDGTFTLTFDGQTTGNIAYNATAAQIKTALEGLSNVDTDDITVTGTLDAGDVTFQFKDTLGNVDMISIDSSSLTPSEQSNYTFTETIKGQAWMNNSSNSVTAYGMTMTLYDTGTVQISLNKDTGSLKSKLRNMVNAYNSVRSFIKEKTAYDKETAEAGVLISNYTTRVIKNLLRTGLTNPATGFTSGEEDFIYAYEIGLDFSDDQDKLGLLELDEAVLDEAIAENYEAVAALMGAANVGKSSGNDETLISFYESSQYTQVGDYDVEVTTEDGEITSARIKLSTDSEWHDQMTWAGTGVITMIGRLNEESDWYPERDLQISIDLDEVAQSGTGTYSTTVSIQQGIAGNILDDLDNVLKTDLNEDGVPTGYLAIETTNADKAIVALDKRILAEEKRLDIKELRLKQQFARLEKTLTILQQQFGALAMMEM